MLNIFVCEDNAIQRRTVVQIIQNTVLIEELDMQLVLDTGDPYALLNDIYNRAFRNELQDLSVPGGGHGLCITGQPC